MVLWVRHDHTQHTRVLPTTHYARSGRSDAARTAAPCMMLHSPLLLRSSLLLVLYSINTLRSSNLARWNPELSFKLIKGYGLKEDAHKYTSAQALAKHLKKHKYAVCKCDSGFAGTKCEKRTKVLPKKKGGNNDTDTDTDSSSGAKKPAPKKPKTKGDNNDTDTDTDSSSAKKATPKKVAPKKKTAPKPEKKSDNNDTDTDTDTDSNDGSDDR
jgi:hypothetical protein